MSLTGTIFGGCPNATLKWSIQGTDGVCTDSVAAILAAEAFVAIASLATIALVGCLCCRNCRLATKQPQTFEMESQISAPDSALYSVVQNLHPKNDVDLKCQAADPVVTINAEKQLNVAKIDEEVIIDAPDSALYSVVQNWLPKNGVDLKCQAADPVVTINAETQLNVAKKSEEVINVAPDSALYSVVRKSYPKNDVDLKCQAADPVGVTINAETQLNVAKKSEEVMNVAPDSALYSVVQKSHVDLKCQAADPVVTINAETQLNVAKKSEEVINVRYEDQAASSLDACAAAVDVYDHLPKKTVTPEPETRF